MGALEKFKFARISLVVLIFILSMGALVGVPKIVLYMSVIYFFVAFWSRDKIFFHSAMLFVLLFTSVYYFPSFLWNIPTAGFLLPFFLSVLFVYPWNKNILSWMRVGEIDQITGALIILTACLSALALILWAYWSENLGVGITMMQGLVNFPRWLILLFAIPLFAVLNAFAEECVYRGVVQEALEYAFPNKIFFPILLQASAFAAAHVDGGFPNGKVGYLMTFVYALMLGYLRKRSKGLFAPYITHVVADLVIGYYLYFQAI